MELSLIDNMGQSTLQRRMGIDGGRLSKSYHLIRDEEDCLKYCACKTGLFKVVHTMVLRVFNGSNIIHNALWG